jgi:hypothetical protein
MGRSLRWILTAALAVTSVVDILYVSYLSRPPGGLGNSLIWRGPFIAAFIAVMAVAVALTLRSSASRWRTVLLGLSSIGLIAIGFLGIFSIGLPLLAAGLASLAVLIGILLESPKRSDLVKAAAGGLLALAISFSGLELTAQAISCPAHGLEGGTGSSFLGGPFHYLCVDGKLTIRPGDCNHMGASMDPNGRVTAVGDC